MNVFKLRLTDKEFHYLNKESFETLTNKSKPWYQKDVNGESHFAICPSCINTTQIIGLKSFDDDKPLYARHYLKTSISDLGIFDKDAYETCPRANTNKISKNSKRSLKSTLGEKIKNTIIEEFDRVIYLLNKQSPITLSKKAITEMLSYYRQEKGWLYKGCTLDNIPWTFAYMTMAVNVFGKKVPDKDLQQALIDRYPNVYFDKNNYLCVEDYSEFISASFCFMHHKRILTDHNLEESIVFSVADSNQKQIYKKTIEFDHQHFCNLIAKKDSIYRDQSLIDLARKILTIA